MSSDGVYSHGSLLEPGSFTAIGSRKAPEPILELATAIGRRLHGLGWRGRSGGAGGMDTHFALGDTSCEVFLPWKGFAPAGQHQYPADLWAKATAIARDPEVYPGFAGLESKIRNWRGDQTQARKWQAILKLQTRNVFQVLGKDLASPSAFTVCWTPDGALSFDDYRPGVTGGTGTAINLSAKRGIPVANLERPAHRKMFEDFVAGKPLDIGLLTPRHQKQ